MKKQDSDQYKDIFGLAIKAYHNEKDTTEIIVHSPDFDDDTIPVDYLFRDYKNMPALERKALDLSTGPCSGRRLRGRKPRPLPSKSKIPGSYWN
jgi:hypothetical protein